MRLFMMAALVGGLALTGCHDGKKTTNGDMKNTDGMTDTDGGGNDGGPTDNSFEAYVLDLIQNHTNDTGTPDDYTTKTFGTENTDPAFFNALFM